MNQLLQQFFNEEKKREAVKAFLIAHLESNAVEAIFSKKATAGYYEAHRAILGAFDELETLFTPKEKEKMHNSR